jgi:hypothetical protein
MYPPESLERVRASGVGSSSNITCYISSDEIDDNVLVAQSLDEEATSEGLVNAPIRM